MPITDLINSFNNEARSYLQKIKKQPLNYTEKISVAPSGAIKIMTYHLSWVPQGLPAAITSLSEPSIQQFSWEHQVKFFYPSKKGNEKAAALIVVNNGANYPNKAIIPNYSEESLIAVAQDGLVVIEIDKVPNQPLIWPEDEQALFEDQLAARSITYFLENQQPASLIYLQMAAAISRALDLSDRLGISILHYTVTAASKQVLGAQLAINFDNRLQNAATLYFGLLPSALPRLAALLNQQLSGYHPNNPLPPELRKKLPDECLAYLDAGLLTNPKLPLLHGIMLPHQKNQIIVIIAGKQDRAVPLEALKQEADELEKAEFSVVFKAVDADHSGLKETTGDILRQHLAEGRKNLPSHKLSSPNLHQSLAALVLQKENLGRSEPLVNPARSAIETPNLAHP